jgi:uncharacterized protein (DUF2235 family)
MPTRLILCFDGTRNSPAAKPNDPEAEETNVVRFHESVIDGALPGGLIQKKWYDAGVGTDWWDKLPSGVAGFGIDQKIQDGYQFLVDNYPDPDLGDYTIYITGFSRGAYTARSLVGMIRNVGLLKPSNAHRVVDAYALYRKRDASADTAEAQDFRSRYSRPVAVTFLGVWDTVGALGIPLPALQWLNAAEYAFHDTELSSIVEIAAHALAIDEHRVHYQVTLWDSVANLVKRSSSDGLLAPTPTLAAAIRPVPSPTLLLLGCMTRPRARASRSAGRTYQRSQPRTTWRLSPTRIGSFWTGFTHVPTRRFIGRLA